jgi:hypothetical protein
MYPSVKMKKFSNFSTRVTYISFTLLFSLFNLDAETVAQTSKNINKFAIDSLDEKNYKNENGNIFLYGIQTNGSDTNQGKLACAKVASIVLKKAKALDRIVLAVRNIEDQFKNWKKIDKEEDLKPGDIVIWVNRYSGRNDKKCTGNGNCHVGIFTDKGYFHNDPILKSPSFNGVSLLGFYFKNAYRPK